MDIIIRRTDNEIQLESIEDCSRDLLTALCSLTDEDVIIIDDKEYEFQDKKIFLETSLLIISVDPVFDEEDE